MAKTVLNTSIFNTNIDSHINTSTASANEVLSYTGSDYDWVAQSGGVALTDFSVTTNSAGTAALSYSNSTGVFTYTPPDLSSYLTAETNDLTSAVTWANVPNANITESSVTQHQSALSITESQISDLQTYLTGITGQSIENLSDVTTMTPTDGQVLTWDNTNSYWYAASPSGGSYADSSVDSHLNTSTAATNEVLSWNGSDYDWVSQSGGIALTDFSVTTNSAGTAALSYNNSTGAFTFTPPDLSSYLTGITNETLESLSNVLISSPSNGQALRYDATNSRWFNSNLPSDYTNSNVDTHLNTSTASTNEVLSWNGSDYDWVSNGIGLTDLSITTASAGTAALSYNNSTGAFTFTPPDLSSYLTAETNDLTSAVTWANVPNANITESSVTQHQSALSITESQISDLQTYLTSVALNNVSDVTITSAAAGELLRYDGSGWVNSDPIAGRFSIVNSGSGAYVFTGSGTSSDSNPTLYLTRGQKYEFVVNASGHPFYINTSSGTGTGNAYSDGVTNNGAATGTVILDVQMDAPDTLYYNCQYHSSMAGTIYILDSTVGLSDFSVTTASASTAALSYSNGVFTFTPPDLSSYLTGITAQSIEDLSDVNSMTPSDGQVLTWDNTNSYWYAATPSGGGGSYGDSSVDTHLNTSTATANQVLSWTGSDYDWVAQSGGGGASVTTADTAPSSPSDGDLWYDTTTLRLYVYYNDGSSSQWVKANPSGSRDSNTSVAIQETAPSNPSSGDMWFDPSALKTYIYYNDGDSNQWVQANPTGGGSGSGGSGVTTYDDLTARNSASPSAGDLAFVTSNKALYLYDGTEWDRVALGNDESPVITTEPPTTTQELNNDGTTSTVTMTAQDPEGFDITYGIAYKTAGNTRPSQLSADTTIDQSTGVYTFTPTTTTSDGGSFRARLSASDGAKTTTRLVDFNLKFSLEFSDTFNTDTTADYVWDTSGGYSYSWNSGGYVQITGSDNNNFSWHYHAGADDETFPSSGTLRMVAKKTQDWPNDNNGGLVVGRIDPTTSGTPTLTWTPRTYHYYAGLCGSSYTAQLYHRYNFASSSDASSVNVPYKWNDESAYHTFELVYTPTSMALYVDGSLNISTSWTTSDYDTAAAGPPNFCGFEGEQMSMELTELTIENGSPY